MNNLKIYRHKIIIIAVLWCTVSSIAQSHKESFGVTKDVVIEVNTSHTNVVFETWNKDKVEVEAYIDDKELSAKQKQALLDNWDLDILGNSKKVVITSNHNGHWGNSLESLGALKSLKELEDLKGHEFWENLGDMPILKDLGELPVWEQIANIDFANITADIPDFERFENWPFSDARPSIKSKDGSINYNFNNEGADTFNRDKYKKDKKGYVSKLNKKYGTNVSVKETDAWLAKVDQWTSDFEEEMEDWGEKFGNQFEQKFGPEFEREMEIWGENFGENMEKWAEDFEEQYGKQIEQWGESFGKDMEKWAEKIEEDVEKWAEQFGENGGNVKTKIITSPSGSKTILLDSDEDHGLFGNSKKVRKTIIVRMPKNTKTDINVRHGEVKMADAYNIKADLKHSRFSANSIDGGETLINAAYAPVLVNNWMAGELAVNYVEDCRLNKVEKIALQANSSDVTIITLSEEAFLSGSFGNLFVNTISPNFKSLDITLENTDAVLSVPNASFIFYYNGKKTRFEPPSSLELTSQNTNNGRSLLKGFYRSKNPDRSITINASYSNVKLK